MGCKHVGSHRQGELPEAMYFLKAGTCVVRQDVAIVKRNRWPVGKAQWEAREARLAPSTLQL